MESSDLIGRVADAAGDVATALAKIFGPETQSYPECNSIPRTVRVYAAKKWMGVIHRYPDRWEILQTFPLPMVTLTFPTPPPDLPKKRREVVTSQSSIQDEGAKGLPPPGP